MKEICKSRSLMHLKFVIVDSRLVLWPKSNTTHAWLMQIQCKWEIPLHFLSSRSEGMPERKQREIASCSLLWHMRAVQSMHYLADLINLHRIQEKLGVLLIRQALYPLAFYPFLFSSHTQTHFPFQLGVVEENTWTEMTQLAKTERCRLVLMALLSAI